MRVTRRRPPKRPETWLARFLEELAAADLRVQTIRGYRSDVGLFLTWLAEHVGGRPDLSELRRVDLAGFRGYMVRRRRLRPATVNRRMQALRRFCRWATRKGWLREDPTRELKTIRVQRIHRPRGLAQGEVHALLRAAGMSTHGMARRNAALLQVMLQAGLRVGEVAALVVDDLVLGSRSGVVRIRDGKGFKAREIPLNATARRALRAYLEVEPDIRREDPVFRSKQGGPLAVRTIQATIASLARRAGLERGRVTPHTLRHTFALEFLRRHPGKLVELAGLLGHDSLDTTALYTRPDPEEVAADLEGSGLNVYG